VTAFLDKLPTILVLAVLVGIFLSLRRHTPSARVRLWTYAWALILVHFSVQVFETHAGIVESVLESIDLAALELSGIVFVISLTRAGEDRLRRIVLFSALALPVAFHAFAVTFNWHAHWALAGLVGVMALGGAGYAVLETKHPDAFDFAVAAVLLLAGFWAVKTQMAGSSDFSVDAILTLSFGTCGVMFWRRHPQRSPGVIVVSLGFLCWGAVFPVAEAVGHYLPHLQVNPDIWNVPKFFVAFGMVLALIEEKSRIIEKAHERERGENRLLSRLSQISSRLIAGKDPAALCQEISTAITDASSFSRAALLLVSEGSALHLAGSSGFTPARLEEFRQRIARYRIGSVRELCASSRRAGSNSFRVTDTEHEVLIPLVSWRGSHLGCLWLGGMAAETPGVESEIVKLEMLASDLAVTIENSRLHHRLVQSEKLAALGQLVAGVAHELNNPLTGIMGYTELLGEEIHDENASKRVQKLGNEARRMKRIVDGLLRFARQNSAAGRSADLSAALRDVIQLREYHMRKLGIHVDLELEPSLPPIAISEDELKQVLLNLLNNALDAVEESAKRHIRVTSAQQNGRVTVQIEDSGPGFSDIHRAFDPFYTTKPVGKGTGLGLSICYGIVHECGGEVLLANKEPYGARVYLEFPAAGARSAAERSAASLPA
jgi:two-component system, NtrC family, sensor kinase